MYKLISIIVFFLIMPTVVLIGFVTGFSVDLGEKRSPVKPPEFSSQRFLDVSFYADYVNYFNDRFAFRAPLIHVKNWIDYNVFKTSPTKKVVLGKSGWLFYNEELFRENNPCDKGKILKIAEQLQALEKIIEGSGRQFLLIIAPNKASIYPEYVLGSSSCENIEMFSEALKQHPVKNFLKLKEAFSESKKKHKLYFKTDTHWNIYGSLVASKALSHHFSSSFLNSSVEIRECNYRGDLSQMTALNLNESDYCYKVKHVAKVAFKESERNVGKIIVGQPFHVQTSAQLKVKLLPRAIVYRDSFFSGPLNLIAGSFERIDAYWTSNILEQESLESLMASKIVIFEVVERSLHNVTFDLTAIEKQLKK